MNEKVNNAGSRRAVTRTLRLDADVDRKLRALAERERVSINVVANRSLRRFVEWEALAERFRFISVSSDLLQKMLDYVKEEEVRELGKWSILNTARGIAPFKGESLFDEITTLEFLGSYSRRFRIDLHITGDTMSLILTHQMGSKWSILYEEVLKAALDDHRGREVRNFKIERTENQVVAELQLDRSALDTSPIGTQLKPRSPRLPGSG